MCYRFGMQDIYLLIVVAAINKFFGSHTGVFGDASLFSKPVGNFMSLAGHGKALEVSDVGGTEFLSSFPHLLKTDPLLEHSHRLPWGRAPVRQRDADLAFYMHRALTAKTLGETDEMLALLRKALIGRWCKSRHYSLWARLIHRLQHRNHCHTH